MDVFTCQRCGQCCQGQGGIVVSAPERQRLAAHLGMEESAFTAQYAQPQGRKWVLRCREDGFCVFFVNGVGCGVHVAKPDICRAWPFFRGNILDAVSWELAQDACPGINPAAGHARFAEEGRSYLRKHGLLKSGRADEAAALVLPPEDEA
ncbi:MAG: hypothetical protein JG774_1694 [Desulfomicrobiaceae bacterium]|jgi:Fe-S-cluster containining protein|nr:YkgJ family cysteine cluster protein [Desulfomicrobiaceae bacterium]MBZ4648581.1 hypothetical protein [Desulfomicrobiaceae bacterium]MBZ4685949.1 hypothetical protein [Desulfomicrobiaceae bacterium]MDI3493527.1 uncharacterized protein [Desulfomicrobiaceae bacterium]HCF04703.1 YkgJ family cysteine cluster protein [Desulfomicrobiaceae bacterium]